MRLLCSCQASSLTDLHISIALKSQRASYAPGDAWTFHEMQELRVGYLLRRDKKYSLLSCAKALGVEYVLLLNVL